VHDFFEESLATLPRDTNVYKIKIEAIWWYFYIEYITNSVISVKKDAEQEDGAIIILKMKSLSLVQTERSDLRLLISR
jgi:hypothetical protein